MYMCLRCCHCMYINLKLYFFMLYNNYKKFKQFKPEPDTQCIVVKMSMNWN